MPGTSNAVLHGYADQRPFRSFKEIAEAQGYTWRPPLLEYGPEVDDRWCLRHYQPDAPLGFYYFMHDTRLKRKCSECENERRLEWLGEVRLKLRLGLAAAACGERVAW